MIMGKRLRVYYMAQVAIQPPKFVFFVNIPSLMTEAYKKYLYNQFREKYGFMGVPLLFYLKGKKKPKTEQVKAAPNKEGLIMEDDNDRDIDEDYPDFDDDFDDGIDDGDLDESYFKS